MYSIKGIIGVNGVRGKNKHGWAWIETLALAAWIFLL